MGLLPDQVFSRPRWRRAAFVVAAGALALSLMGCAGGGTVTSSEPERDHRTDADMVEWMDHTVEIADTRLRVGVRHDDDWYYIGVLSTQRATVQQIAARGLTLWFDASGEKTKGLGLRYPVGMLNALPGGPASEEDMPRETDERMDMLRESAPLVDLYFEEDKPIRRQLASLPGLEAAYSFEFGAFTMELRIPRSAARSDDFAVPTPGEGILRVGFATEQAPRPPGDEGGNTLPGARGNTGGFGAVGRDFGGRGAAGPSPIFQGPIDEWIKVLLR